MASLYSIARGVRKRLSAPPGSNVGDITVEPAPKEEEPARVMKGMTVAKPDPMRGVTDPKKLLKSDTQRIDRNVHTPEEMWQKAPKGGGSSEMAGTEEKKI